jgi:hypothetical protein
MAEKNKLSKVSKTKTLDAKQSIEFEVEDEKDVPVIQTLQVFLNLFILNID